jgi:hypothetical protein
MPIEDYGIIGNTYTAPPAFSPGLPARGGPPTPAGDPVEPRYRKQRVGT